MFHMNIWRSVLLMNWKLNTYFAWPPRYSTFRKSYLLRCKAVYPETIIQGRNQHEAGRIATLNIEATYSSETYADFKRITRRYVLEDKALRNHCCENPTCYNVSCIHFGIF
jgi:hypothetical protein